MIVSREYVPFRTLIESNDPAGQFFIDLLHETYPEDMWDEALKMLLDQCLYQREMEWGFIGIRKLIDGFKKFDKELPYDNGYDVEDIWDAQIIDHDGKTLTVLFKTVNNNEQKIVAVKKVRF